MKSRPVLVWVTADTSRANAGYRIRILPLAESLRARGIEVHVITYVELLTDLPAWVERASAALLSKPNDTAAFLSMLAFQARGKRVAIDVFDNYLSWSPGIVRRQLHWQLMRLLQQANLVICSTAYLKRVLASVRDDRILKIADPLPPLSQTLGSDPTSDHDRALLTKWPLGAHGVLECTWFGIAGNDYYQVGLQDLDDWRDTLVALRDSRRRRGGLRLTLCTNRSPAIDATLARLRREGIHARYIEWNEQVCDRLLQATHVTLLPTNLSGFSLAKTHNRCTDALARRSLVLASPGGPYASMHGAVKTSLKSLTTLLDAIEADPTRVDREVQTSLAALTADSNLAKHAERLSDRLLGRLQTDTGAGEETVKVLVVGIARMEAIKLSRRLGYLTAGVATGLVKANMDITLSQGSKGSGIVLLGFSEKGLQELRSLWALDPASDVLGHDGNLEVRRAGWRFFIEPSRLTGRILAMPSDASCAAACDAPSLGPPQPHRLADWYNSMIGLLSSCLLGLGVKTLVYASDEGAGWEAFSSRADVPLATAVARLEGLWRQHAGVECDWGADRAPGEGLCQ